MDFEFDGLTSEEIEDLAPVELGEDELMKVEYVTDNREVLKYPIAYRDETEEDRKYVHLCDLGGAWIGPITMYSGVLYTECGLVGKPWIKIIAKSYGRQENVLVGTREPAVVDCPLCLAGKRVTMTGPNISTKIDVYEKTVPKDNQSFQSPKRPMKRANHVGSTREHSE